MFDVDGRTCKEAGLHIDPDTIKWWGEQSKEAQEAWQKNPVPLQEAIDKFTLWYGKESIPIWGYGANFDVVILESAYRALDMNIDERPQVTNYIGECFVKIANHLAYKSNFVNYTFRDEMILDGIENCLTYMDNFDPAKSKNPFAYFTQIIYYAFIRRIQKEKKQLLKPLKVVVVT